MVNDRLVHVLESRNLLSNVLCGFRKDHSTLDHLGLRIALGAFRTSLIKSLYAEAGEPSLDDRRMKLAFNYVLKLKSLPRNPCHDVVFEAPLSDFSAVTKSEPNLVANTFEHFKNANISLNNIDNLHVQCPPSTPPWEEHNITVDISLTKQNKENTSEVAYQKEFFRIKEKFSDHYALFTDGSKREEKVAAAAYFPEHPDRSKSTRLRDGASVFSAELEGIALPLTEIKKKLTKYHKNFVIYSDSLSALQAIQSKNFKVIDISIRRLYNLIRKFPRYVHISFVWIPAHVGIRGNENVDKLAKAALNRTSTSGKLICYSDLKPKINTYIKSVWQRDWDAEGANKLHEVLPNLGEDLHRRGGGAGRKRETAKCRLRVGHTWLTQSYLLKNEEQPFCYACDSLYTVQHILIECLDFQDTRRKYFSVTDLYRLFRETIYSGGHTYERGVGILFDVTTAKSLGSWCPISDRVVVAKLVAKPLSLGIIQVYAPTSDIEDVEVEKFYEEIEKAKGYLKSQDIIIVMGDFNAKVGDERVEDVVGPSGIGTVNERGNRLIEWCQVNDLSSQILGFKTTLGDSGLGRAPEIEVETK
ncbi:ribonuclease hi [Plakobranchus ocellatus]|uniref:Ribonuclease hi n=1 Tax=Plakobranchus ocellatus TaxID=259542 RepID=A0AAV3ZKT7_9GAST|nr:ribonuclease hi [Plakobranchus ocellatus]